MALMGLFLAGGMVYLISGANRYWAIALGVFLLGTIIFHSAFYSGALRNWGVLVLFLSLISLLTWNKLDMIARGGLITFFIVQLLFGVRETYRDITLPYTNAYHASTYIGFDNYQSYFPEILGIDEYNCTPLVGYLEQPFWKIEPSGHSQFTYYEWGKKIYLPSPMELVSFKAKTKKEFLGAEILVVTPQPLPSSFTSLELVAAYDKPSIKKENYYIYELR